MIEGSNAERISSHRSCLMELVWMDMISDLIRLLVNCWTDPSTSVLFIASGYTSPQFTDDPVLPFKYFFCRFICKVK